MQNTKTSLSGVSSVEELGDFWDTHDLGDFENETSPIAMRVEIEEAETLFHVERSLSEKLQTVSKERGVSAETLLNLWLQERVAQETGA